MQEGGKGNDHQCSSGFWWSQTKERNHLPPRQLPLRQFIFLRILRLIRVGKKQRREPSSSWSPEFTHKLDQGWASPHSPPITLTDPEILITVEANDSPEEDKARGVVKILTWGRRRSAPRTSMFPPEDLSMRLSCAGNSGLLPGSTIMAAWPQSRHGGHSLGLGERRDMSQDQERSKKKWDEAGHPGQRLTLFSAASA